MALISVAEALDHVLAHAAPLPAQEVPIDEAAGRVLAHDLKALRTQPPADVSAMDGYAVRAADLRPDGETVLKRVGESFAGKPWPGAIGAGECVRLPAARLWRRRRKPGPNKRIFAPRRFDRIDHRDGPARMAAPEARPRS